MKDFAIHPKIRFAASVIDFFQSYNIGSGDLVFASRRTQQHFPADSLKNAMVIDYRSYASGEPTDQMVESIAAELAGRSFRRVFALGGGTILDVAKLFALKRLSPVDGLFMGELPVEKACPLILVPTTCGTGSEVTNISILSLTKRGTKTGLASDALYADEAVLMPELLADLPPKVFGASSIDALIHAIESYTSPKANACTQLFSLQAMDRILCGYKEIVARGEAARISLLPDFLLASTYAGIAFGNAGCAAVHAMSYPLGAACHVPHGEANYVMFTEVYKAYRALRYDGSLQALCQHLADLLDCKEAAVFDRLEELLGHILAKKKLPAYGVTEKDLDKYTEIVMTRQGRLMANNYTELDAAAVLSIYKKLF